MKKTIKNTLTILGFILIVIGWIVEYDVQPNLLTDYIILGILPTLSLAFIFAENKVVKNIGYGFSAILGAMGIIPLISSSISGFSVLFSIGTIIMFVSALLYLIEIILAFFGFIKCEKANKQATNLDLITEYSELKTAGVITAEDFDKIKADLFNKKETKNMDIEELKKWKKLVDQKIVSEEEYKVVKDKILKK